ncbi:MAG: RHS repeat-associated core domain-containing protein, partial [Anaerolineae bacterium]|nr:RHS repeat-associated core domain-containing protein [Anaerolineae bacterium]
MVCYLHADHLGSTSLVTDHASRITARQRYYPYGEVRWREGTLPTDFTFTGQRVEAGLGLLDYRARFYNPVLGRFVSADTVVPNPGNPQDLNRYAYVRNNPLRYTDPSGYLTEDQIKAYLGVETWEDVLAFFEAGGELEGRWGWLETLRAAELGDEIQFFENYSGLWPPLESLVFRGSLEDWEGQLYIQSEDARIPANKAAWLGNAFDVARPYHDAQSPLYFGPFHAEKIYYHAKFDPSKVD